MHLCSSARSTVLSCLEKDARMVRKPRRKDDRPTTDRTSSSPRWLDPNRRKARDSLSLLEPAASSIRAHMADDAGTYPALSRSRKLKQSPSTEITKSSAPGASRCTTSLKLDREMKLASPVNTPEKAA